MYAAQTGWPGRLGLSVIPFHIVAEGDWVGMRLFSSGQQVNKFKLAATVFLKVFQTDGVKAFCQRQHVTLYFSAAMQPILFYLYFPLG